MQGCLTLWSVIELHVNEIELGTLNHVIHDIRGNNTLWGAGDNVFTSVPCFLCLLHEVAEGANEPNVVIILSSRTVLNIKVEAVNNGWNEVSFI